MIFNILVNALLSKLSGDIIIYIAIDFRYKIGADGCSESVRGVYICINTIDPIFKWNSLTTIFQNASVVMDKRFIEVRKYSGSRRKKLLFNSILCYGIDVW